MPNIATSQKLQISEILSIEIPRLEDWQSWPSANSRQVTWGGLMVDVGMFYFYIGMLMLVDGWWLMVDDGFIFFLAIYIFVGEML